MEDFEEIAPHILFDLKNRSNSLSKSGNSAVSSPQIFTGQDADGVPASPVFGRSSLSSSSGLRNKTGYHSPSNSFVLYDNSNNNNTSGVANDSESTTTTTASNNNNLKSSSANLFSNMFYQSSSSGAPFSSIPIPLRTTSPTNTSLRSSAESLLSTSTDSITNSCSLISLSSSPLQSVPSSPPSKPIKFHSFKQQQQQQQQYSSSPSPTWASIMRVVFFTLHHELREKPFFSLKTDVYEFMTTHWDILCLNKKRSENWHKQIQDMLSHSKNIFESGMDTYKQNGFWRLKQIIDPWTMQKGGRKNSTNSIMSSPVQTPGSPITISSSSSTASHASSPRQTSHSINIPRLNTSPLILSNHGQLFDDFKVKRSSIDMLLSTSLENLDMDSPRKKRLSDSGEVHRNYTDDPDELYIDDNQ
ncbi:hypothetical protein PPL_09110 [Heterostelium album PN500]|uniref:Uncharacterized protein n=1 Tax=Heterostelium pallidum (strain ATCC 26659 / Pp 5 / PN500) TaxID=670386 RepID=D3BKM8_HETP5|nr:hypothetical protein PPL_09110 [Heterostelium album PN500]EFA78458.1 hypothetical protein PPL_09110 [Heterostelium album PN500]|eukprot:XP_020430582.1 hypothetical protein PPL_09110 [Heterostelium album PN500]